MHNSKEEQNNMQVLRMVLIPEDIVIQIHHFVPQLQDFLFREGQQFYGITIIKF